MSRSWAVEPVTSPHNPLIKEVRRAAARASLTPDGHALAEGFHLLDEALASELEVAAILAAERAVDAVVKAADRSRKTVRILSLPEALFRELASTENSQGVIALVRPPTWDEAALFAATPLLLVLDGVQDPGNAGTLVRAAEAFGASGAVFLKGTVDAYNPKALRAAAGSLFRLPLLTGLDHAAALAIFERRALKLWATDVRAGTALDEASFDAPCAIVIGSEAHGVSSQMRAAAEPLNIPTSRVESLNAAAAGAVVFYAASRQRKRRP
jgi:TrmH family RNA methyltransferase